MHSKITL